MKDIINKSDATPGLAGQLPAAEYNDHKVELQKAVEKSGQTLNASITDQLSKALFINGAGASSMVDSGTANSVLLSPETGISGLVFPDNYSQLQGSILKFNKPVANTTTAVIVNAGQSGTELGAKNLVREDGSAISIGELIGDCEIKWDVALDKWLLLKSGKSETVSSIAELRTKIGFHGQKVDVLGYYTAGDVSDMPSPVYDANSIADDNGGSVIRPTAIGELQTGRWVWNRLTGVYAEYFGVTYDGVDRTAELINFLQSGYPLLLLSGGTCAADGDQLDLTLTQDLTIKGNYTTIKCLSTSTRRVLSFQTEGFQLNIENLTIDANNGAFQGLSIENNTIATLNNVLLNNVSILNVYRSSNSFVGGDGISIRGGYRKVLLNNPKVVGVKMATGTGTPGVQGVSGITIAQNTLGTLMARYVEINNPYIENIYSEDLTYSDDQDGMKLFGITGTPIERGSCVVTGGAFKNCYGRSIKFQRPDGIVKNCTFIRDAGNTGGNSEIDFQRGGGTVRDIRCEYDGYQPVTVVNSYQNITNEAFQFLVDGVDIIVENIVLNQVVQRFGVAFTDVATPITIKNVRVIGEVLQIFRYLTANSSSGTLEQAILENIFFGEAAYLAQIYGNNTDTVVKIFIKNIVTTGSAVLKIEKGVFSNAVGIELYEEDIRGFVDNDGGITSRINPLLYGNTEGEFVGELTPGSGSIALVTTEKTLSYTKRGRIVTVKGKLRVLSTSTATGVLKVNLPFNAVDITLSKYWQRVPIIVSNTISKNSNDFALGNNTGDANDIDVYDVSGALETTVNVANQMQGNTALYINYSYLV